MTTALDISRHLKRAKIGAKVGRYLYGFAGVFTTSWTVTKIYDDGRLRLSDDRTGRTKIATPYGMQAARPIWRARYDDGSGHFSVAFQTTGDVKRRAAQIAADEAEAAAEDASYAARLDAARPTYDALVALAEANGYKLGRGRRGAFDLGFVRPDEAVGSSEHIALERIIPSDHDWYGVDVVAIPVEFLFELAAR